MSKQIMVKVFLPFKWENIKTWVVKTLFSPWNQRVGLLAHYSIGRSTLLEQILVGWSVSRNVANVCKSGPNITGTPMLGRKKSMLGKLGAVPLCGTFFGPKNSPLRHAVLGGKNLILGPDVNMGLAMGPWTFALKVSKSHNAILYNSFISFCLLLIYPRLMQQKPARGRQRRRRLHRKPDPLTTQGPGIGRRNQKVSMTWGETLRSRGDHKPGNIPPLHRKWIIKFVTF